MTNHLFQQYIELLKRASRTSNEAESRMLVERANAICRDPAFLEPNHNNCQDMNHTSDSIPGNCISSPGHAIGNMGYGFSRGSPSMWT